MNINKRIGMIMPEISDNLNYERLNGVYDRAKAFGYDLLLFTGVFNSQLEFQYDSYINGLENIYELICKGRLDGVLFAADLFNNEEVKQRIFRFLNLTDTPCLIMDAEYNEHNSIFPNQRESVKMITNHLINEHKYRKLYCMTGIKDQYDSEERLKGFHEAVEENGIDIDEKCIFYGNFWIEVPRRLAEDIACGKTEKPDAVVCANDAMAIALCNSLIENGIRVPDDVAVTGYDGSWHTYINEPQITTVCGNEYHFGAGSMEKLHRMLGGNAEEKSSASGVIRYGTSCGCVIPDCIKNNSDDIFIKTYINKKLQRYAERKMYVASNHIYSMAKAESLEDLITRVDKLGHLLPDWKWLDICLCNDWNFDLNNPDNFRQHGFSDKMLLALSKRYPTNDADGYYFSTDELIPALNTEHKPLLVVFTSLHCDKQIFGYISTAYDDPESMCLDEYYVNWCDAVSNGLNAVQKKMYNEYRQKHIEITSCHDPETGLYNKKGLKEKIPEYVKQCTETKNKTLALLLISNIRKDFSSEQIGIDDSLIIANALRLSSCNDELYARLGNNVFAVVISDEDESSCKAKAENRILKLEKKIRYIQGDTANYQMPEFISDYCLLCSEAPEEISELIKKRFDHILEKSSAAANRFLDYKAQLQQLRREIYISPQENWSIPVILKRIGISRSHLQRIYKEQFSVSCIDDIINARLERAQQLLNYTDMRIQEIAYQCGYSNESHFMRQFKDKFGITATQYRKHSGNREDIE